MATACPGGLEPLQVRLWGWQGSPGLGHCGLHVDALDRLLDALQQSFAFRRVVPLQVAVHVCERVDIRLEILLADGPLKEDRTRGSSHGTWAAGKGEAGLRGVVFWPWSLGRGEGTCEAVGVQGESGVSVWCAGLLTLHSASGLSVTTYLCLCAKSLQLCPTLWDPMDCSPPGSFVHGILQARIVEWTPIPYSRGSSQPMGWTHVSYISCIGSWVLNH